MRAMKFGADPIYRISKLPASGRKPLFVAPDAKLQEVVTHMLSNDLSQLPVMTNERDVKGIITWTSIGSRLAVGKKCSVAREFMEQHQEIRWDASLISAIGIIAEHQYVLVRGCDQKISGIVTAADLSLQFQQLAEPFLLLGEIENHVRRVISHRFSLCELEAAKDPADHGRTVTSAADLSYGEYIRLLANPERWDKLNIAIDRITCIDKFENVRRIRNEVMHFDPEGLPEKDLLTLREFARFLQKLQMIDIIDARPGIDGHSQGALQPCRQGRATAMDAALSPASE
ncbi:CBS domain-containing protein [Geomonas azotofigens]|uniref:CBS domain-containing protein n=1 Tax=Geomonas azotofigens TaxID=2843196 RepID=UPI001C1077CC|nr:CBS domain-containing protein [Geomonas azotofigens]MBU5613888.1 CBS domain-containing protein [Geomonas azotofigens]